MTKLNVPPTKSSALSIGKSLDFAREGFELLDQKRRILVLELMGHLDKARRVQKLADEALAEAFAALKEAQLSSGSALLEKEALAVNVDHGVELSGRRVMGIDIPEVTAPEIEPGVQFGISISNTTSDDVMKTFNKALKLVGDLAEVESAVFRLAIEVKKTQRRVNALEKIFLPQYRETLKYINATLEERDREDMIIMKMIKQRREE
ncbi:MAG: V-type ATP synthase subunit D [Planctomycetota bacterium]|nr:MAG: V-type ATP synthase subunit D [Planctomycetota bacterium]